ncbi:MAG: hypothetical protein JJ975_04500, partial [Bacteroidia bacterium]|nr:hypothetical protein [Bacteroidia bacterium]
WVRDVYVGLDSADNYHIMVQKQSIELEELSTYLHDFGQERPEQAWPYITPRFLIDKDIKMGVVRDVVTQSLAAGLHRIAYGVRVPGEYNAVYSCSYAFLKMYPGLHWPDFLFDREPEENLMNIRILGPKQVQLNDTVVEVVDLAYVVYSRNHQQPELHIDIDYSLDVPFEAYIATFTAIESARTKMLNDVSIEQQGVPFDQLDPGTRRSVRREIRIKLRDLPFLQLRE